MSVQMQKSATDFYRIPKAGIGTLACFCLGAATGWLLNGFASSVQGLGLAFCLLALLILLFSIAVLLRAIKWNARAAATLPAEVVVAPVTVGQIREMGIAACESLGERGGLTKRETEVLDLLARGRNASFISERLTLSPHTVKSHIYRIYRKLGVSTQQEVISMVEFEAEESLGK